MVTGRYKLFAEGAYKRHGLLSLSMTNSLYRLSYRAALMTTKGNTMSALDKAFTIQSQAAATLALLQSCTAYEQHSELSQVGALLHDMSAKLSELTATLDA